MNKELAINLEQRIEDLRGFMDEQLALHERYLGVLYEGKDECPVEVVKLFEVVLKNIIDQIKKYMNLADEYVGLQNKEEHELEYHFNLENYMIVITDKVKYFEDGINKLKKGKNND